VPAGGGLLRRGKNIAAGAVLVPDHPVALPDEEALGVDDAAAEELCNHIDDAGAAETHRLLALLADDGEGGLHGGAVDGDGLDGAVGGPHAAADVAALKGGTGGAGAGHHRSEER